MKPASSASCAVNHVSVGAAKGTNPHFLDLFNFTCTGIEAFMTMQRQLKEHHHGHRKKENSTVRGFLSMLKKAGKTVTSERMGNERRYFMLLLP